LLSWWWPRGLGVLPLDSSSVSVRKLLAWLHRPDVTVRPVAYRHTLSRRRLHRAYASQGCFGSRACLRGAADHPKVPVALDTRWPLPASALAPRAPTRQQPPAAAPRYMCPSHMSSAGWPSCGMRHAAYRCSAARSAALRPGDPADEATTGEAAALPVAPAGSPGSTVTSGAAIATPARPAHADGWGYG
jgi:hypothetical protein